MEHKQWQRKWKYTGDNYFNKYYSDFLRYITNNKICFIFVLIMKETLLRNEDP